MNKQKLAEVMSWLGSRTSADKTKAAKKNGKLGGRPVGAKDSKPRKRGKSKA
jgi:hypothetical protein